MTDKPESQPEKSPVFKENLIRLVTVFAYASSVSMAALCLSSYYVFFWEPKPPGPGPPTIHPQSHAYMSDPYPPLKLVAPSPGENDLQGASFWQSVWSYFKPGGTTTYPPAPYTTRKPYTTRRTNSTTTIGYINSSTADTIEILNTNESTNDTFQHIAILGAEEILGKEIRESSKKNGIDKRAEGKPMTTLAGYVGVIPNRAKRGNSEAPPGVTRATGTDKSLAKGNDDSITDMKVTTNIPSSTSDSNTGNTTNKENLNPDKSFAKGNSNNIRDMKVTGNNPSSTPGVSVTTHKEHAVENYGNTRDTNVTNNMESDNGSKLTLATVDDITTITASSSTNTTEDEGEIKAVTDPVKDKETGITTIVLPTTMRDAKSTMKNVAKRNIDENIDPKRMKIDELNKVATDLSTAMKTTAARQELEGKTTHIMSTGSSVVTKSTVNNARGPERLGSAAQNIGSETTENASGTTDSLEVTHNTDKQDLANKVPRDLKAKEYAPTIVQQTSISTLRQDTTIISSLETFTTGGENLEDPMEQTKNYKEKTSTPKEANSGDTTGKVTKHITATTNEAINAMDQATEVTKNIISTTTGGNPEIKVTKDTYSTTRGAENAKDQATKVDKENGSTTNGATPRNIFTVDSSSISMDDTSVTNQDTPTILDHVDATDPHYQHHTRQLKPRRKFPGH